MRARGVFLSLLSGSLVGTGIAVLFGFPFLPIFGTAAVLSLILAAAVTR